MAWPKDAWCVLTAIKVDDGLPIGVLSIHRTKAEAQTLASNLVKNDRWPTTTRLMKYTRYIRDLRRGDVLCCHRIDAIVNYLERDHDAVRKEIREADQSHIYYQRD